MNLREEIIKTYLATGYLLYEDLDEFPEFAEYSPFLSIIADTNESKRAFILDYHYDIARAIPKWEWREDFGEESMEDLMPNILRGDKKLISKLFDLYCYCIRADEVSSPYGKLFIERRAD